MEDISEFLVKFKGAIDVLHALEKKSRQTRRNTGLTLTRGRLKQVEAPTKFSVAKKDK